MLNLKINIGPLPLKPSITTKFDHDSNHICKLEDYVTDELLTPRSIQQTKTGVVPLTPASPNVIPTVLTPDPVSPFDNEIKLQDLEEIELADFITPSILTDDESDSESVSLSDGDDADNPKFDDIPTASLLKMIAQGDEDIMFAQNGYSLLYKICDSLQGYVYKARVIKTGEFVVVKKVSRKLTNEKIASKKFKNDGSITPNPEVVTFCVEENILKEAVILKHLTVDNIPTGGYIPKFVDFFESDEHYYLVRQYVDGVSLKEFISSAHKYIKDGRLDPKGYRKCVKYIVWQLVATLRSLHDVYHCCHLDLCLDNIMLANADFEYESKDIGKVTCPKTVAIKLIDFGVAEIFKGNNAFKCSKQGLSVDNEMFQAPTVSRISLRNGNYYDARAADMWQLGMIYFEAMTGQKLYEAEDMWYEPKNGYWAIMNGQLKNWLSFGDLLDHFKKNSFDFLQGLLNISAHKRLNAHQCCTHLFFKSYYKTYQHKMNRKMVQDRTRLQRQAAKMTKFPYYRT